MGKSTNTFKFVGFNDRINSIHIDTILRCGSNHLRPTPGKSLIADSFFYETLDKWSDLNGTLHFDAFKKSLPRSEVRSYAQILHFQKDIAEALTKHLNVENSLCLQALFELTVAFCRDLQSDFYAYFWQFFDVIKSILDRSTLQDTDFLESSFTCYAYLLKFCWRRLITELNNVFSQFLPLLSHNKSYIRRFASESAGFLIRKCPDIKAFADLCSTYVKDNLATVDSIAMLFYESIKSVKGRLHSMSSETYSILLDYCSYDNSTPEFQILKLLTVKLVEFTKADSLEPLLAILLKKTNELKTCQNDKNDSGLVNIFEIWSIWISNAVVLHTFLMQIFQEFLLPMLDCFELSNETTLETYLRLPVLVCENMTNSNKSEEFRKYLTTFLDQFFTTVLSSLSVPLKVILKFHQQILFYHKSLPYYYLIADFCEQLILNTKDNKRADVKMSLLIFLCNLCSESSSDIVDHSIVEFADHEFWIKMPNLCAFITLILDDLESMNTRPDEYLCALYLYVHFAKDRMILLKIFNRIVDDNIKLNAEHRFLAVILLIRTLERTSINDNELSHINFDFISNQIRRYIDNPLALNCVISILDTFPNLLKNMTNDEFLRISMLNLLSLSPTVRMNTIKALSKFHWNDSQEKNIFDIMLECESVPLTLQTYRDKLICYKKLGALEYERYLPEVNREFRSVILYFLIAQFNVNFTLLFSPVHQIIESHARCQKQEEFWDTFSCILHFVQEKIDSEHKEIETESIEANKNAETSFEVDYGISSLYKTILKKASCQEERVSDAYDLRLLAWRTIENFADLAESKTRFLSELILDLAKRELQQLKGDHERFEHLLIQKNDHLSHYLVDEKRTKNQSNVCYKTLVACLNVYSKFNDIKNVSKEKDLRSLYFDLLLNYRLDVQQAALNCILAYNKAAVTPYTSHLKNLLDDKQFKEELVLFNIDSESNVLDAEHRSEVMRILIRLLYGALRRKSTDKHRREQIYRFLAGCSNEEMNMFFKLLFNPLNDYLGPDSLKVVCETILATYDLNKSIPLRKLKGILSHLKTIICRLAYTLNEGRSLILRVCCVLAAIVLRIRKAADEVLPHYAKSVKALQRELILRIAEYFTYFESYNFTDVEISTLFDVCLIPLMKKIETRDRFLASSDLLKLGNVWSENPRFFIFLGTYKPSVNNCTLLEILILSLNNNESNARLRDSVSTIIFNLLNLSDYVPNGKNEENGGSLLSVQSEFSVKFITPSLSDSNVNFGTQLVLPYADILLRYLSTPSMIRRICRNEKWTKILNVLTEFADNDVVENLRQLLTLLFSIVRSQKSKNLIVEENILSSIDCLLKKVEERKPYLSNIAELYLLITNRLSREKLLAVFRTAVKSSSSLEKITDIVLDLNSWDPKTLEEPDYDRRLKACVKLNRFLKSERFDAVQCSFITYNCFYLIIKTNDNILRGNAGELFITMIERMSENFDGDTGEFLTSYILPTIRKHLKNKDENIRHELLNVLHSCIKHVRKHSKLIGLFDLLDVADSDLNFFENIRHIQLHRRYRAIHRLCDKLEDSEVGPVINTDALFRFIWPLCYSFIFDPAFSKNSTLIQESVRFLGIYCRRCSWKRYESMLKYFLQCLRKDADRQKLNVKLVVVILDAFHFEIKNSNVSIVPSERQQHVAQSTNGRTEDAQYMDAKSCKIFDTIANDIIPELRNCLTKKTSTDIAHRTNRKSAYDEDEEILRVPLALALVKLFQKLGDHYVKNNLSNVLTKICQMLKSRSWDIREMTRKVLCNIASSLGPKYLSYIIRELKEILKRGYQLHVLTYSVNVLLESIKTNLSVGDIDTCLEDIICVCKDDLFGDISEQKEVDEITKNLKEAKARKTATFKTIGQFISASNVDRVIDMFKGILEEKFSHKIVKTIHEALKHFAHGLILNASLTVEFLTSFTLKILQDNTESTNTAKITNPVSHDDSNVKSLQVVSCLIIGPEPRRAGVIPKRAKLSSLNLLVTFALEIHEAILKNNMIQPTRAEHCSILEPFVSLYLHYLHVQQTKIITLAMRCLCLSLKFPVSSIRENCQKITQQIFVLLSRFSGLSRLSSGGSENGELLSLLFKAITVIVRDLDCATVNLKQLKILLNYVDEDLNDSQKQLTAFNLIKAILSRKLSSPEIKPLMKRIEQLCVESQTAVSRQQCRSVLEKYLKNYPEGKRPKRIIEFFCAQLDYEYESGRASALETISTIIDTLEQGQLSEFGLLLFVNLSLRLVNDESNAIRRTASDILCKLFENFNDTLRTSIFQMILEWLSDEKILYKKLAAHLLMLFTNKIDIHTGAKVLPRIINLICSLSQKSDSDENRGDRTIIDHTIYLLLNLLEKLLSDKFAFVIRADNYVDQMNIIWGILIKLVDYAHGWIQFVACRIIGILLPTYETEELLSHKKNLEYFVSNPNRHIKVLCETFLRRLRSSDCTSELAEQIVKNLSYLSRHIRGLSTIGDLLNGGESKPNEDEESYENFHTSLKWLTVQLCRICRFEIIRTPNQYLKRTNVFKWFAGLVVESTRQEFAELLPVFLPLLHRATTLSDEDPSLKQLAAEIIEMIKDKIGSELFVDLWSKVHSVKNEKRAERKRKLAEQAISDPEKASRRKMRKHRAQKESKKRKLLSKKGSVKKFKRFKTDSAAVL